MNQLKLNSVAYFNPTNKVGCPLGRRVSQWLLPATAAPTTRPIYVSRGHKDAGPGVHLVSPGLLQLTVIRHRRRSHKPAADCPESGCTFGFGCSTLRPHHASATGAALASGSTSVDFKMATLVYLSLSGMAPAYLAADCQLVSDKGRRQLRSATSRTCVVRRTYSNYGDRCSAAAGPKLWNSLPAELRQWV